MCKTPSLICQQCQLRQSSFSWCYIVPGTTSDRELWKLALLGRLMGTSVECHCYKMTGWHALSSLHNPIIRSFAAVDCLHIFCVVFLLDIVIKVLRKLIWEFNWIWNCLDSNSMLKVGLFLTEAVGLSWNLDWVMLGGSWHQTLSGLQIVPSTHLVLLCSAVPDWFWIENFCKVIKDCDH